MNDDFTSVRLEDVKNNIEQDLKLLKAYEDELRNETDPRTMRNYEREIERQRKSLTLYREEYQDLKRSQAAPAQVQNVADLLQQNKAKLNAFQKQLNQCCICTAFPAAS